MDAKRLADMRGYELANEVVDCRGWRVYDCHGVHAGFIEDLFVELRTGCVKEVVLHIDGQDHLLPHNEMQLDCDAQRVHLAYPRDALLALPTIPSWHPVDRHRARAAFFPGLTRLDDWGEVELEDMRASETTQRGEI